MSRELIVTCDRCGRDAGIGVLSLELPIMENEFTRKFDLCHKCVRALREWILVGLMKEKVS